MYIELMLLVILIMPIPVMINEITKKREPYLVIGKGIVYSIVGLVLVFFMTYITGNSLGDAVDANIDSAVNTIVNNKEMLEVVGLADVEKAKAIVTLKQAYSTVASMLPAVLIVISAVIAYIEYNILVRIKYSGIKGYRPTAYLRNFFLKNNDVMGWFLIYLVAYLIKFAGADVGTVAVLNINILVEMIIALQGISLVMLFFYTKKIPKVLPIAIIIIGWMLPFGKTVLFTLGLLDLLLNMRKRITQ